MIARVWHGRTRRDRADAYAEFVARRAVPDYRGVEGNLGAWVLRRDAGEETHFLTFSLWESEAAIRAFAGDDLLRAKYYDEDGSFLIEFEREVTHYEVVAGETGPAGG